MAKRKCKIKCPGNMHANQTITNRDNRSQKIKVVGFTGFEGYRYHPTKGLRKEAGFDPVESKVVSY